jgi:hypothetical protein
VRELSELRLAARLCLVRFVLVPTQQTEFAFSKTKELELCVERSKKGSKGRIARRTEKRGRQKEKMKEHRAGAAARSNVMTPAASQ